MKRFVFLVAFLTLAASCEEEAQLDRDFVFDGLVNQKEWRATQASAHFFPSANTFQISGTKRDSKYYQEEQIRLSFTTSASKEAGGVPDFQGQFLDIVGGDAVSNSFAASSTDAGNSLTITKIDTINRVIEGNFELRLKRDPHWTKEQEYLDVKKGGFKVKYRLVPDSIKP